jgi:hypothetical protein
MPDKPGDWIHWPIEVDWRNRGRRYGYIVLVNIQEMDYGEIAITIAYLQVVTMASSLSSVRHVRALHRRAYSIIAEFVARLTKRLNENPSLHKSNINIAVLSLTFIETERKSS